MVGNTRQLTGLALVIAAAVATIAAAQRPSWKHPRVSAALHGNPVVVSRM